jgi:hypothetical protein
MEWISLKGHYTRNAIEDYQRMVRKVTKAKETFTSEDTIVKQNLFNNNKRHLNGRAKCLAGRLSYIS